MDTPNTMDTQDLNKRISDLEIHLSHQEGTIQELSDITAKQWDIIDDLTRKVDTMRDRLFNLEGDMNSDSPSDPLPPHF